MAQTLFVVGPVLPFIVIGLWSLVRELRGEV